MRRVMFFIALAFQLAAGAQTIPVNPKFGAVSDQEVDLQTYADTSAIAVILYRNYSLNLVFNSSLDIVKEVYVHERIKVLKEEGKKYADYSFLYFNNRDVKESYSNVKVLTFNREGGKVVSTRMSKKYEFDDKYSENARKHAFTAENVKVGSVIEVSYKFISTRYWDIDDIYLQQSIPVNEAVAEVGYAEYFKVNRSQRGRIATEYRTDSTVDNITVNSMTDLSYRIYRDIFRAVDIPALPVEPYSFNPVQYRSAISYELSGLVIPGAVYKSFSQTWSDVDKAVAESDIVQFCKGTYKDPKELEEALEGVEGDEQRIHRIRKFISDRVNWNETSRLVPDSPRNVLKQGSGSDADINALTATALHSAGYLAEPVLIRRRTSGMLFEHHISQNTFDTFVLRVSTPDGSRSWILDAARKEGALNVLNPDFLIEKARIVHPDGKGEWTDLSNLTSSRVTEVVTASVREDGTMVGEVKIQGQGEDSYEIKHHYNEFDNEDAYLDEIESDESLDVLEFAMEDDYGPSVDISYSFEKDVEHSGERIYIRPFLSEFHSPSSFAKEKREIPVDFPYPENVVYHFLLDIPEGYHVEEMPESVNFICPSVGGRILFQCQEMNGKLSVIYRFSLNSVLVFPENYPDLRLFWETAVGVEKTTIVLKKQ